MNFRTFSLVVVLSVFFLGCQLKSSPSEENASVDLASDSTDAEASQPLEASFMSDRQSFSYRLFYDGQRMQIVDGQFDGATVVGPSFSIEGGAQLVVKSGTVTELQSFIQNAGPAVEMNGLTMYQQTITTNSCTENTVVVPVSVEALILNLKVCDDQNLSMGQQAMYELLNGLELTAL